MYKHILFGSDLLSDSLNLGKKVVQLAQVFGSQLSVVHVIEPPTTYRDHSAVLSDAFDEMKQHAQESLVEFCTKLKAKISDQSLAIGTPKFEIVNKVKELNVDLVVVASHGGGGFRHKMGSTANGIIDASPCDVLVLNINSDVPVKIKDDRIFFARQGGK